MKVLITGGGGFIGSGLINNLLVHNKYDFLACVRRITNKQKTIHQFCETGNIDKNTDWSHQLSGCSVVVHLAACAHHDKYSREEILATNVDATLNLAKQSIKAGIKRFIFLSSIGVNGKSTKLNQPFTTFDDPRPYSHYTFSKYEAEKKLFELTSKNSMELVIIRPALVYGAGAPGNIEKLIKLINTKIPIPFLKINNLRSFVYLNNLLDLIVTCFEHSNAKNKVFLVSDDKDISTSDFIYLLGKIIDSPVIMFNLPMNFLKIIAKIIGKSDQISTLTDTLQIDMSYTKEELNWNPPYSIDEISRVSTPSKIKNL